MIDPVPSGIPEIPGYRDLVRIGRGGFATVYLAREEAFDRNVAIKVMEARDLDEDAQLRFERECRAIGSLSHQPGIVTVHAVGTTTEGRPYLVMEHVPGGSLGARLKQSGPVPAGAVVQLGLDLLTAVEAAHGLGIVHRDIKPDNILLRADGRPVLGDFGISSMPGAYETRTGNMAATVGFAAPEIVEGERATAASDLYSLAATLAAALVGRPLFATTTEQSLVAQINRILREAPPDLTLHGASPELDAVLRRGLAKAADERYATAAELRAALCGVPEAAAPGAPPPAVTAPDREPDADAARTVLRSTLTAQDEATIRKDVAPPPPPVAPTALAESAEPAEHRRIGMLVAMVAVVVLLVAGGGTAVALLAGGDEAAPATGPTATADPAAPTTSAVERRTVRRFLVARGEQLALTILLSNARECGSAEYRVEVRRATWQRSGAVALTAGGATTLAVPAGRYRVVGEAVTSSAAICPAVRSAAVTVSAPPVAAPEVSHQPTPQPAPKPKPAPKPTLKDPVKPR